MPIKTKIIKLSKELLSIAYRRKKKNILLARIQRINSLQRIKKRQSLVNLKELVVEP